VKLQFIPLVLAAAVSSLLLAQDSFLNMGTIKGDSTVKGYEDQIVILGFTYEGSILQKVTGFNTIVLSKRFDKASPKILEAAVKGTYLPDVTLTLTLPLESGPAEYARVRMRGVTVTGVAIHKGSEGVPLEDMTLQYDQAEWCTRTQNAKGIYGPELCTAIVSRK
jgi:type VI secretion system Hcp family effector